MSLAAHAEAIPEIVCGSLEGWRGIDPGTVLVEEIKDGIIFKASVPAGTAALPSAVMFRFRRGGQAPTTLAERRTEAAALLFGKHGVSPSRIAQGDTWWIEPWAGVSFDDLGGGLTFPWDGACAGWDPRNPAHRELVLNSAEEYGRLMARIHVVPPEWFEPFKQEDCVAFPFLGELPSQGSFLWLYQYWGPGRVPSQDEFGRCMAAHSAGDGSRLKQLRDLLAALPTPRCPALARLVTSHGDIWDENVLWKQDRSGVLACDIESACVMSAIYDWMHGQLQYFQSAQLAVLEVDPEYKPCYARAMMRAYLEQLGEPAGDEEVDMAIFDVRSFSDLFYIRRGLDAMVRGPHHEMFSISDVDAAYATATDNIEALKQSMEVAWADAAQRALRVGPRWSDNDAFSWDSPGEGLPDCQLFWTSHDEWRRKGASAL